MGNTLQSNKARPTAQRQKRASSALKDSAAQQLRAGTDLLTEAMSEFATASQKRSSANPSGGFRQAYASIVQFLPKGRRLAMLEAMRQSIDEVVREESKAGRATQPAQPVVSTADFMAGLEQQERAQREHHEKDGALLPGPEMQQRLQVSPQALSAALKRKRIFALTGASGKYVYPAFFADPRYDRTVLERVCQTLGDLPGSSKLQFFTSPRLSLGGKTPLQALLRGQIDAVLDQANAVREA